MPIPISHREILLLSPLANSCPPVVAVGSMDRITVPRFCPWHSFMRRDGELDQDIRDQLFTPRFTSNITRPDEPNSQNGERSRWPHSRLLPGTWASAADGCPIPQVHWTDEPCAMQVHPH
ncbi:hypothetical protein CCHR01_05149 [Colletotrichum chrysophilum]|uniref:Uncharacterized protein n=1 Tax=Colletotrichum chrysophilum TaxID=1836956 RepID=A0AAD9ASB9_9PEZI|nr:hypothetical protein CCHR01_05149 [Colletotrichum chrysophilum]